MSLADEVEKLRREVARGAGVAKVRLLLEALEHQQRGVRPSTMESLGEAAAEISNRVYLASAGLLEGLERAGKIAGSGHHGAQLIAKMAEQELRERWANMDRIRRDVEAWPASTPSQDPKND